MKVTHLKKKHFLGVSVTADCQINESVLASLGLKILSESIGPGEGSFKTQLLRPIFFLQQTGNGALKAFFFFPQLEIVWGGGMLMMPTYNPEPDPDLGVSVCFFFSLFFLLFWQTFWNVWELRALLHGAEFCSKKKRKL